MDKGEKEKLKAALIEWISKLEDAEVLSFVREVQESYATAENYSAEGLEYIRNMLEKSDEDIRQHKVSGQEALDDLFAKWRKEGF